MNHAEFTRWLESEGACPPARKWVAAHGYDREAAIRACEHPDRLVWLAQHEGRLPHRRAVEILVLCARHVWDLIPEAARPAVIAGEAWLADPCARTAARAAEAAWAAAWAAEAAARAARAAEAAARAARAADDAAWAARAADDAAWAAARAARAAEAAARAARAAEAAEAAWAAWAARADPDRAPALCGMLRAELFPEVPR